MSDSDVTQILNDFNRENRSAAEQLLPLVYDELRRLAAKKMRQEAVDHTLQPTALVHEVYLRLAGSVGKQHWESRGHFYAAAAEAMRRILVEEARRKHSLKRGGQRSRIDLDEDAFQCEDPVDLAEVLAVSEALEKLSVIDPEAAHLIKLRYFAGVTVEEAAEILAISPRTVKRNWSFARAWLQRELCESKRP